MTSAAGRATDPVLEVEGLEMHYSVGSRVSTGSDTIRAVDGVDLTLRRGEIGALVGESGSGKTTVGKCVLRLAEPTRGRVRFLGTDITHVSRKALRPIRREMHVVFQDPFTSLNPRMTIGRIVISPLVHHRLIGRRDRRDRAADLLEQVGLGPQYLDRYPHSLSGGQRQRVAIARAISAHPSLLVADEPISALDASVQAAMLNLLMELQAELAFSCLFITHDLSAARFLADWVAVMYLGQVVEVGPCDEVFNAPRHPYTQALLSAVPVPDPAAQRRRASLVLAGDPPSPVDPPAGCRFHTRCPIAVAQCRAAEPRLTDPTDGGHEARCHLIGERGEPALVPMTPSSVVDEASTSVPRAAAGGG